MVSHANNGFDKEKTETLLEMIVMLTHNKWKEMSEDELPTHLPPAQWQVLVFLGNSNAVA